jgi:callose synthase
MLLYACNPAQFLDQIHVIYMWIVEQEHYFEETIKMRNLLQEFRTFHGIRKPTILGVREHVFTGSVSSLAWFMSAQETVFVTLSQRVLANPLKIRMHYGHPDVFDRLWFISRGGISKASRTINISEDIFAGFNCTLRGGTVTHHEYIQAGKGRDVGLNQIAMFEAKVASGNGEQVLSRDVYRLGHRLDFFRMLSFYYTTVGFFISNMIVVLTIFVFLWGRVYLALSGIEASLTTGKNALANKALTAALNQQLVVQLGLLTILPMVVENALELGFTTALWDMITMQLQLASVFFTFSMGTRMHYFGRTLLHGGAKYRATGRGFVVKHEKFAENYRLYSRSHFTKGIELILLLVVYEAYGSATSSTTYILVTITSWFLALTWIMAPFVFNPSGFDWLKTVEDYDDFMQWLWFKGDIFVKVEQSWEVWWEEEQSHFRTTGMWGKLLEIVLDLRFFLFQYGIVYHLSIANGSKSIFVYLISWSYMLVAGALHYVLSSANERFAAKRHGLYRAIQAIVIVLIVAIILVLLFVTNFKVLDLITSLLAFLPTGWGILQICLVLRRPFLDNSSIWRTIKAVARLYDLGMGMIVMAPVAILSWLPGFQAMQTRILYNQAFSRGLQISRLLVGKKGGRIGD